MQWLKKLTIFLLFVPFASSGQSKDCLSSIDSKLLEILESDKEKVITDQFLLTTLKISKRLGESSKSKTLEEHVRKTMNFKDQEPLRQLKELYSNKVLPEDRNKLEQIKNFEQNHKGFSYYKKHQRMTNQDISTYLLIEKELNGADYNEMDLAISWYMQKVIENSSTTIQKFSEEYNLSNISTHVARNRGGISDAQSTSHDIEDQYQKATARMNSFSEKALDRLKSEVQNCSEDELCQIDTTLVDETLARLIGHFLPIEKEISAKVQSLARTPTKTKSIVLHSSSNKSKSPQVTTKPKQTKNQKPDYLKNSGLQLNKLVSAQDNTSNNFVQKNFVQTTAMEKELKGVSPDLVAITRGLSSSNLSAKYSCLNDPKKIINYKIRRGNGFVSSVMGLMHFAEYPATALDTDTELDAYYWKMLANSTDSDSNFTVLFTENNQQVPYGVNSVKCLSLLLESKCTKKNVDPSCKIENPYKLHKELKEDLEIFSDIKDANKFINKR